MSFEEWLIENEHITDESQIEYELSAVELVYLVKMKFVKH